MAYESVNPYVTVEELAEELKIEIPEAGSTEEDKLKRAIDRASRWIDDWVGETFYFRDFSETPLVLDQFSRGVYSDKIFLPYKPVIEIDQIDVGTDTLVEGTDYVIGAGEDAGRIFRIGGSWNPMRPDGLVQIWGTFGYVQDDPSDVPVGIPGKINLCTLKVAAALTGDAKKEFFPVDGDSPEAIAMTDIPKIVFQTLGRKMPILT